VALDISGVFVAADVHYLASGGARAAAVVAADAGFSRLVADRVELVPESATANMRDLEGE